MTELNKKIEVAQAMCRLIKETMAAMCEGCSSKKVNEASSALAKLDISIVSDDLNEVTQDEIAQFHDRSYLDEEIRTLVMLNKLIKQRELEPANYTKKQDNPSSSEIGEMKTKTVSSTPIKAICVNGKLETNRDDNENVIPELSNTMFGVNSEDVFTVLLRNTIDAVPSNTDKDTTANYVMAMLLDLRPQDAMEAMLITQMIAVHSQAMEWSRRAVIPEQTEKGIEMNVSRATRLMRTFTSQVEALQKYRNKGKQTIQVQHINVATGGQAIVGDIRGGGR